MNETVHSPTRPSHHRPGVRLVVSALLAALTCGTTAACYSSFVFSGWARSPLPVTRSYVSEMEAVGQPHRELFRLSDVLSGAGILVVAVLLITLVPRRPAGLVGCALLAVAGAASLFDAANSMACVPSIDAACRAQQDTVSGLLHQVLEAHTLSSLVGFLAAGGAMLLVGVAVTPAYPWLGRLSITCAVVTGLAGLGDGWLILADGAVGLTERARIVVFSGWLVAVGVQLLCAPRRAVAVTGRDDIAERRCPHVAGGPPGDVRTRRRRRPRSGGPRPSRVFAEPD